MDHTAVDDIKIRGQRMLQKGEREAVRQSIETLTALLAEGLSPEQGGPIDVSDDILDAALKVKMQAALGQTNVAKLIAQSICTSYRQRFVEDVNELCGNELPAEKQEFVASRFNIVLAYWLRAAADSVQEDTKDFYDLEAVRGS